MWIESLKNIVKDQCIPKQHNNSVQLTERNRNATLRNITIANLSDKEITLHTDYDDREQFFVGGTGGKRCDYIILSERHGQPVAIFIEIKSSIKSGTWSAPDGSIQYKATSQLRATFCFLKYINEISKAFKNDASLECFCDDGNARYVIISGKKPPVIFTPVARTREIPNTTPNNPKICYTSDGGALPFEELFSSMMD